MHPEEVDVCGLELLKGGSDGDMQGFCAVAHGVDDDFFVAVAGAECGRVFCGDDHLIAVLALFHPFADPLLGLLGLVVVGTNSQSLSYYQVLVILKNEREGSRINKVAAILIEEIENCFGLLLAALAHILFPCVTEVHGSQA